MLHVFSYILRAGSSRFPSFHHHINSFNLTSSLQHCNIQDQHQQLKPATPQEVPSTTRLTLTFYRQHANDQEHRPFRWHCCCSTSCLPSSSTTNTREVRSHRHSLREPSPKHRHNSFQGQDLDRRQPKRRWLRRSRHQLCNFLHRRRRCIPVRCQCYAAAALGGPFRNGYVSRSSSLTLNIC